MLLRLLCLYARRLGFEDVGFLVKVFGGEGFRGFGASTSGSACSAHLIKQGVFAGVGGIIAQVSFRNFRNVCTSERLCYRQP